MKWRNPSCEYCINVNVPILKSYFTPIMAKIWQIQNVVLILSIYLSKALISYRNHDLCDKLYTKHVGSGAAVKIP